MVRLDWSLLTIGSRLTDAGAINGTAPLNDIVQASVPLSGPLPPAQPASPINVNFFEQTELEFPAADAPPIDQPASPYRNGLSVS
jgi:hypothetical protein